MNEKTVQQQQTEAMKVFINAANALRAEDPISPAEMRRFIDWYQDLIQQVTCVNFVLQGMAVPYFDEDNKYPQFSITDKGYAAIPEGKDKSDELN